jgi:hypothetical protein
VQSGRSLGGQKHTDRMSIKDEVKKNEKPCSLFQ